MKLKYSVILLLGLASSLLPAAQLDQPTQSSNGAVQSDPFVEFEYVLADVASETYELIELQKTTRYHLYLEFSKDKLITLNALDNLFYKQGGYNAVVRAFKLNKADGLNAAIAFFQKIANIIDLSLPSSAGLMTDSQKLNWLKNAAERIKKEYKTFKPTLKKESIGKSIQKAIIFNPVTRHIPLTEMASGLSSQLASIVTLGVTAYYQELYKKPKGAPMAPQKSIFEAIFSRKNISTTIAVMGIQGAQQMLSQYLQNLAAEKKKFVERERFAPYSEDQEKIKEQLHSFVSHTGTGPGFSTIRGIQDDKTIKELTWFANWLKHPISYFGSKLAIMLYGEPGNGKGIITKALSDESKTPMITISADDVQKRQISLKLWAAAQLAKYNDQKSVIVFFDEIDLIIPQKDKAALQTFLTFLDGTQKGNPHVRILYVFATNHIEKLDPRMLRPGRFKSKIYVGPPSLAQRAKLIEMSLLDVFKTAPKELVDKLAVTTDGLSRVAIHEAIENTYNNAALTEEAPDIQSFLDEIEKLKEVTYRSTKQIA